MSLEESLEVRRPAGRLGAGSGLSGLVRGLQEARTLPDLKDISLPVLERYFRRLFALADTDGNGVLDPREFHNVRSGPCRAAGSPRGLGSCWPSLGSVSLPG